jgi:hypothetical protein
MDTNMKLLENSTETHRAAAYQLHQDKDQDMRQKRQKLTPASWLRPVCGGFHNLIHFSCAPFFVSCLDACWCAAYHKVYLKIFGMCSIGYSTNVNTIFKLFPRTPQVGLNDIWYVLWNLPSEGLASEVGIHGLSHIPIGRSRMGSRGSRGAKSGSHLSCSSLLYLRCRFPLIVIGAPLMANMLKAVLPMEH